MISVTTPIAICIAILLALSAGETIKQGCKYIRDIPWVDEFVLRVSFPELIETRSIIESTGDIVSCRSIRGFSTGKWIQCTSVKPCKENQVLHFKRLSQISDAHDFNYEYRTCVNATPENSVRLSDPFTGECEIHPYHPDFVPGMLSENGYDQC